MSGAAEHYRGYAALANAQVEGTDYKVHVRPVAHSSIAVIAPHGGSIEQYTSDIALAVAGQDFNLYLFEGIRRSGINGSGATLELTLTPEGRLSDVLSISSSTDSLRIDGNGDDHVEADAGWTNTHADQTIGGNDDHVYINDIATLLVDINIITSNLPV